MTADHRKVHKIIWSVLAFIVPLLIIFSVLGIRKPVLTDADLFIKSPLQKKHLVLENEIVTIFLEKQNTVNTLQIFIKRSLQSPASSVYATSSKNSRDTYLGVVDKKGAYTFNIERSAKGIKIYDELKNEDLINIELPWD